MENLEEEIKKIISDLSLKEQMSVSFAVANIVMKTQAELQDYVGSKKFENKYKDAEENIDTQITCIKETVEYGLDKFTKAYDKSKELKVLGEKSGEVKKYVVNAVGMVLQLGLVQEYLPKYLIVKTEELPKNISNTKKMEKIKEYVSEFAVKIGAGKEIEQVLQFMSVMPVMNDFY